MRRESPAKRASPPDTAGAEEDVNDPSTLRAPVPVSVCGEEMPRTAFTLPPKLPPVLASQSARPFCAAARLPLPSPTILFRPALRVPSTPEAKLSSAVEGVPPEEKSGSQVRTPPPSVSSLTVRDPDEVSFPTRMAVPAPAVRESMVTALPSTMETMLFSSTASRAGMAMVTPLISRAPFCMAILPLPFSPEPEIFSV